MITQKWKELIVLGTKDIPIQYLNAYFEIGEMWIDIEDKRWIADRYLELYLKLTKEYRSKVEFVIKRNKADKLRKKLGETFRKLQKEAWDKIKDEKYDDAEIAYKKSLYIKPESDYSMLIKLLQTKKKWNEIVFWADRAVIFYENVKIDFIKKKLEEYFFIKAKTTLLHIDKKEGKKLLEEYKRKCKEGKFEGTKLKEAKAYLELYKDLQTKPDKNK